MSTQPQDHKPVLSEATAGKPLSILLPNSFHFSVLTIEIIEFCALAKEKAKGVLITEFGRQCRHI